MHQVNADTGNLVYCAEFGCPIQNQIIKSFRKAEYPQQNKRPFNRTQMERNNEE